MDQSLLKRLRALFEEERRLQWKIGDELIRHFGNAPPSGERDGSYEAIGEVAQALGQSVATLLEYRRMASTFAPSARAEGASYSAHRAAVYAKDPAKVMTEVAERAEKTGGKIRVADVHHVAAQPEHRKPEARPIVRRNEWDEELIASVGGAKRSLGRLLRLLRQLEDDEELKPTYKKMVGEAMDQCGDYIHWIRAILAGEDVADEAEDFLRRSSA